MDLRSQTASQPQSRSSSITISSSSSSRSSRSSSRAVWVVLGVLLCLSLSKAAPVSSQTVPEQIGDPYEDEVRAENAEVLISLLNYLRALLSNSPRLQNESALSDDMGGDDNLEKVKRGFGIAGLDNVDMITSTLDRSRAMSRARQGRYLSSSLSFKQLRALMERAG